MMKQSAEALRIKILEGAVALFIEKGIGKVTTRELTESVGISRSHIYHYFSNWQTLAAVPPPQRLGLLFESYLPNSPDAVWQLYASFWQLASHNPAYAALAEEMTAKWQGLMESLIAAEVENGTLRVTDVARTARQLSAMLNGYADLLTINPSAAKAGEALDDLNHFVGQMRG